MTFIPSTEDMNFPETSNRRNSLLPVAREDFLSAMSCAVTGVTIVTTDGMAGRYGVTVSAMTSVSADPPTLLVCINRKSPAAQALLRNGAFCVNLLSDGHTSLSDAFSGRSPGEDRFKFDEKVWQPGVSGAPRLTSAVAAFDCKLLSSLESGSHIIFVGRVVEVSERAGPALAHHRRSYCTARPIEVA